MCGEWRVKTPSPAVLSSTHLCESQCARCWAQSKQIITHIIERDLGYCLVIGAYVCSLNFFLEIIPFSIHSCAWHVLPTGSKRDTFWFRSLSPSLLPPRTSWEVWGQTSTPTDVSDPFHLLTRLSFISAPHETGTVTLTWLSFDSLSSKVIGGHYHHLNDRIQIQWLCVHIEPCPEKPSAFNSSQTKGNETKLKKPQPSLGNRYHWQALNWQLILMSTQQTGRQMLAPLRFYLMTPPALHPFLGKMFSSQRQGDMYSLLLRPEFMLLLHPPLLTES